MVFSRVTGVLTFGDVLDHMDRLSRHPDFRPTYDQIIDFRQATEMALSDEEIRDLARRNIFGAGSRRAFLVNPGLQYGLARVFETYREMAGEHGIRIFTDDNEALSWVSLREET